MNVPISDDAVLSNWGVFHRLATTETGDRGTAIAAMLEIIGTELAAAPASSRRDFHNAFPGGLVDHSLRVMRNAAKYSHAMSIPVRRDSLIIATLFHDLGKVGDGDRPHYVPQQDQWRRDKLGELYAHNASIQHMSTGMRGLYVMQRYGVRLEQDEYLAICLNDGWVLPENKQYCLKEPALVHVVQTADYLATLQEKRGPELKSDNDDAA